MVFIPNDFSSTYVVTHYTDPSSYNITTSAPFAASLINSTQILPAPTSNDQAAAYAASDTSLVQIDSEGNIYYITNAVSTSDYTVQGGAAWTKMSYTLAGTGGTNVAGSSSAASASAASTSGSTTASASASAAAGSGSAKAGSTTASGQASGAASASASPSSTGAAGMRAAMNMAGLFMGVAAVGGAIFL
jgi:hypothetical protein